MELIEITGESELFLGPDPLETTNELIGASIAFAVVQPPLTDARELGLKPARHHIHCDPSDYVRSLYPGQTLVTYPWE